MIQCEVYSPDYMTITDLEDVLDDTGIPVEFVHYNNDALDPSIIIEVEDVEALNDRLATVSPRLVVRARPICPKCGEPLDANGACDWCGGDDE